TYLMTKEEPYADGFKLIQGKPQIKELDLTTYSYARQRWIVKLHGSIWQYKYESDIFKTIEDPKTSSIPVRIEEEMLIYPTGEKPILRYPYYNFYNVFKMQRWQKLVVIGYSFRDDPVNNAIIENLEKTPYSILIVINPDPEKVIKNMEAPALSGINDRIIPVKGRFGTPEVFQKLGIALIVANKERYYKRLQSAKVWERLGEPQTDERALLSRKEA
ncbi:SIR2 family protein, partial [Candidatus Bathyarchaeota archaeon]|nr:SIR2 family protein [Candidatus Bathyarchaeota archaeon]